MMYKHDYDRILTRLTSILARLNDGESLSVKELASEFGASERTIQRDFNDRLVALFPIYQENKKWKMKKGFKLEKTKSFEDEIVLNILEKITEGIGGKFAGKSHKLLSKIKNEDFNPIYTKLNIEDISDRFNDIKIIETAIKEKKQIDCCYDNERDTILDVRIKPLKIVNYEGFWYLVAFHGNELNKYYFKNVSKIKETDVTFSTTTKIDNLLENSISIWFQEDREAFEVKIYADAIAAKYFKRRPLPTQQVETINGDGSIEFVVTITYEMEIMPIVKYWLPHLRVLEPLWIQEKIEKELTSYINNKT